MEFTHKPDSFDLIIIKGDGRKETFAKVTGNDDNMWSLAFSHTSIAALEIKFHKFHDTSKV